MRVLLINPEFPDTYWSFRHALPFEGKRCAFPPLGLLTVSALLPPDWDQKERDPASDGRPAKRRREKG